jgi:hypothetical protein
MDKGGRIGWQEASHPPRVLTARPKVSMAALKRLGLILALLGGCVIAAQYGYNYGQQVNISYRPTTLMSPRIAAPFLQKYRVTSITLASRTIRL